MAAMRTAPRLARIGARSVSATTAAAARTLLRPLDAATQSIGVAPIKTWKGEEPAAGGAARLGSLHAPAIRLTADDGAQIYAEVDEGDDGYGLTVVFTHGYTANRNFWHFQRLALRERVRMVFWDFRGHGRSPLGPSTVTVDRLADDLLLVLTELVPTGPVILVGHSMGGMTIMALARAHPELFGTRVLGVALMGTSARMTDYDVGLRRIGTTLWRVVPGVLQRTIGRPEAGSSVRAVRGFTRLLEWHFMREALFGTDVSQELLEFTTDMVAEAAFENLGDVLSLFKAHDVTAALRAMVDIEAAVITGDRDAILPVAHSSVIAEGIPRALFSVIPGAGHHVPLEMPELVNPHLIGLLQRVRYRLSTQWYAAQDPSSQQTLRQLRDQAISRSRAREGRDVTTRMTALQRVFMRLEQQDYPMDTMGIFVLEPGPCGPLDYDTVRAHLDQQVRAIPAFTRQQSHSLRGIAEERWMRTTAFDIHDHLASVSAPPPGDVRALRDLAVALSKTPLDRRRPLWKAWYVEGGADGTTALLLRVHLAVTERLGGMSVENALFTPAPRGVDRSMLPPPLEGDPYPTEVQMVARGVLELVGSGLATGRELAVVAGQQARHRLKVRGRAARRAQAAATLPGNRRAPKTLFDGAHRTPAKSLAVASLPRAEIAAITARCPGLTSTDVILAVVAGGVRAYLERYDHVPDRPLRTACPMFVPADAHGEDPFTVVLMSLPVDVADRAERVATIHRRNARRIRRYEGAKPGNRALVGVGDASHPTLVATLSSLMSTGAASLLPAWINLTVGVFRSSDEPLYFADAKVAHVYGRTLVLPPQRVFIHAALYDRWVEIGVTALRDLLREPGTLLAMMREELAAIGELAADGGLAAHLGA